MLFDGPSCPLWEGFSISKRVVIHNWEPLIYYLLSEVYFHIDYFHILYLSKYNLGYCSPYWKTSIFLHAINLKVTGLLLSEVSLVPTGWIHCGKFWLVNCWLQNFSMVVRNWNWTSWADKKYILYNLMFRQRANFAFFFKQAFNYNYS